MKYIGLFCGLLCLKFLLAKVEDEEEGGIQPIKYELTESEVNATVSVFHSAQCSEKYLEQRGISVSKYRSAVNFNPEKVVIDPPISKIPGCFNFVAKDVRITQRLRDLKAEVQMFLGEPRSDKEPLPCGKPDDDACYCGTNDTCMFCGFCKNLKRTDEVQSLNLVRKNGNKDVVLDSENSCTCKPIKPGKYDIEAKFCTPSESVFQEHSPAELRSRIMDGQPVSLFITVYLYDISWDYNNALYQSLYGKMILFRQRATSAVGCYLMGTNVKITD